MNDNEFIDTGVKAAPYVRHAIDELAEKGNITPQNVRAYLAGRSKHCKAEAIILEYARLKQAEARQIAQEIGKQVK